MPGLPGLIVVGISITLGAQTLPQPSMPYVDVGACPFEGCTYGDWLTQTTVKVVSQPPTWTDPQGGRKPLFTLHKGEKVTAMTGLVIFRSPGRARILQPIALTAFVPGFPNSEERLQANAGEVVYLLTNHGEFFFTGWFKNRMVSLSTKGFKDASRTLPSCETDCRGEILTRGDSEWWVQIRSRTGRIGWVKTDPAGGDFLIRQ